MLGDFGESWATSTRNGGRLGRREDLLEIRAGVGIYKAPEARGRRYADRRQRVDTTRSPRLQDLYCKAESFSIGALVHELLCAHTENDLFDKLAHTHYEREAAAEAAGEGRVVGPGRRQPAWEYVRTPLGHKSLSMLPLSPIRYSQFENETHASAQAPGDVPVLPGSVPGYLRPPIVGLVQCWIDERTSAAEALQMLDSAAQQLDAQARRSHCHRLAPNCRMALPCAAQYRC